MKPPPAHCGTFRTSALVSIHMNRVVVLVALLLAPVVASAADLHLPPLLDTAGNVHRIAEGRGTKAAVVVFLNPTCPLCQRYAPARTSWPTRRARASSSTAWCRTPA